MKRSPRKRTFRTLIVVPVLALLLAFPENAPADKGSHLIFYGPIGRYQRTAKNILNPKVYDNKAVLILGRPMDENEKPILEAPHVDILAEIERRGNKGEKFATIDIIGHGYFQGVHITNTDHEGPHPENSRLTAGKVREWVKRLRRQDIDPRGYFTKDAAITIRACFVGRGARSLKEKEREDLPQALLKILPEDGKVISDFGKYSDHPSGLMVGGWARQRITTHKKDEVFDNKNKGPKKPYRTAFKEVKARVECKIEFVKDKSTAGQTRWEFVRKLAETEGIGVTFSEKQTFIWVDEKLVPESQMGVRRNQTSGIRINWCEKYSEPGQLVYRPKEKKGLASRFYNYLTCRKGTRVVAKYVGEDDNEHPIEVECTFVEP